MQVQSAYASGMQGLQSAQQGLAQATTAVATPDQQKPAVSASTQDTVTLSSQAVSQSDQTSALIDATQLVNQAQASTKVIEAASETVGSLIDIEV